MDKNTDENTLPVAIAPSKIRRQPSIAKHAVLLALGLCCAGYILVAPAFSAGRLTDFGRHRHPIHFEDRCAQPDPVFPSARNNSDLEGLDKRITSGAFRDATIDRLSGAVKVKTESFDDLGVIGQDPRWDVFYDFHAYLEKTFPLIYENLVVEKINTHGLLYTWKGSDESLKPTLLMAHQDTVPVAAETIDTWKYPPWSGEYDGKYIWGRGSNDCKNQLIANLETMQLLLEAKFEPKRTVLLSFGFDEECSGRQGAEKLANFIHERYGDDGIAVIVDEGASYEEVWGTLFFKPGTAEKGYTDVDITVRMPGGHSSIPGSHTSIGVLSEIITQIEAEEYRTHLDDENPYYAQLQCGAAHSPKFPSKLKHLLSHRLSSSSQHTCRTKPDRLALEAAKQGLMIKYLMQTSQAVDVISGGVKNNALPERASATVNHRINIGETSKVVYDRLTALAGPIAKKHNLTLHAFDGHEEAGASITLADSPNTLEVAPVTPADASVDGPFRVLAGTTRALYGENVVVAPGIMTGNTDTRFYWKLTKHIFRFSPGYDGNDGDGEMGNIHTVNERISVDAHVAAVRWFALFVRNMDEATF